MKTTIAVIFALLSAVGASAQKAKPPSHASVPATHYYFWSGNGSPKTRVSNFQYALKQVFERAGIVRGYCHRFRDTFAVSLLLASVPIERVAILLGHSNTRVTSQHYSPWIQARQDQLEQDVIR